jgi:hypothetical protein
VPIPQDQMQQGAGQQQGCAQQANRHQGQGDAQKATSRADSGTRLK